MADDGKTGVDDLLNGSAGSAGGGGANGANGAGNNANGGGANDAAGTSDEDTTGAAGGGGAGGDDDGTDEQKQESRLAYELRQARKQQEQLRKELEGYKRRDEDSRKAALTEEQRLQEENKVLREQLEQEKVEKLRAKVAAEFRLPPALRDRLVGSDEESLRADAEELQKFVPRPKVGSPTNPVKETAAIPTFKRSQLRDPKFFKENEKAIREALAAGRITND